jgi:hypothetical protein
MVFRPKTPGIMLKFLYRALPCGYSVPSDSSPDRPCAVNLSESRWCQASTPASSRTLGRACTSDPKSTRQILTSSLRQPLHCPTHTSMHTIGQHCSLPCERGLDCPYEKSVQAVLGLCQATGRRRGCMVVRLIRPQAESEGPGGGPDRS